MKLIIAYIQPEKVPDVKIELAKADVARLSVTNAMGCGAQQGYSENYRGAELDVTLLKKVRLEIAVNEPFVQKTIDAIVKGARTEQIGDGKIFILPVEEAYRIRTGEKGNESLN